jgi:DNA-binding MarR family transcriptional regulator
MDDPVESSPERASALAAELRSVTGKLKRRLTEEANVGGLTSSQTSVIMRLEKEGPATASGLARGEAMRPQSMATIVAALDQAGLAVGAPDPSDGRQTLLSLTDCGRQWVKEHRAARQDWLFKAIQARLSGSEQDALTTALGLLNRLADG